MAYFDYNRFVYNLFEQLIYCGMRNFFYWQCKTCTEYWLFFSHFSLQMMVNFKEKFHKFRDFFCVYEGTPKPF